MYTKVHWDHPHPHNPLPATTHTAAASAIVRTSHLPFNFQSLGAPPAPPGPPLLAAPVPLPPSPAAGPNPPSPPPMDATPRPAVNLTKPSHLPPPSLPSEGAKPSARYLTSRLKRPHSVLRARHAASQSAHRSYLGATPPTAMFGLNLPSLGMFLDQVSSCFGTASLANSRPRIEPQFGATLMSVHRCLCLVLSCFVLLFARVRFLVVTASPLSNAMSSRASSSGPANHLP